MKGSLIVILFFCVGCIMGALNKFQFDTHTISMYILYALMLQVGVSIGSNKNLKTIISHQMCIRDSNCSVWIRMPHTHKDSLMLFLLLPFPVSDTGMAWGCRLLHSSCKWDLLSWKTVWGLIHTEIMTKTVGECPTEVPCLGKRIISGEHSN